jgi:hypothetical protein
MAAPFRPPVPKPIAQRPQSNTAGVTSKDRTSQGPRPDGGAGAGPEATFEGWVPVGGIVMFSGTLADIPDNWHVCDGTAGTPDLRDRFIYGTATQGAIGNSGGTVQHKHAPGGLALVAASAGAPDAHTTRTDVLGGGSIKVLTGPDSHAALGVHTHTFDTGKTDVNESLAASTATADVLPPWFKLAFIQRTA